MDIWYNDFSMLEIDFTFVLNLGDREFSLSNLLVLDGRYADESSNIAKYVKIAALLPDKTVRDVALRCHWLIVRLLEHAHITSRVSGNN